ncbi:MAG: flavin reductase family protein [Bacteroidota bacterium]
MNNQILQQLTYGYYVLTALKSGDELKTRDKDYIAAGTINWLTQVSFEPPMVAVAVALDADLNETIDYSEHFTVHILAEPQADWIKKFAKDSIIENGTINGVPFKKEQEELILEGTVGYFTCKIDKNKSLTIGDHTMHFGEVIRTHLNDSQLRPICTKEEQIIYQDA